jgi:alkylation response protein AidB-like acyl-CoA dehydrogenase
LRLLQTERQLLAKMFPGLDEQLAAAPLAEMEKPGSLALRAFRQAGGPSLTIPKKYGGLGASATEIIRIQRALASRSPSLAVAATMHHYSVLTYLALIADRAQSDYEQHILREIADKNLYVASAFTEGRAAGGVLSSAMVAKRDGARLVITGTKKPCSLSRSMDLLCVSMLLSSRSTDSPELVLATLPANTPGIGCRPFWTSPILAGAESDEVVLNSVVVPDECLSRIGNPKYLDALQYRSIIWFELLIASAYLGVATALVETTLTSGKGSANERALLLIEVEGAMAALDGVALSLSDGDDEWQMVRSLFARYSVQRSIDRVTSLSLELLGGMAFITSPSIAYLQAAARALTFHPPSRLAISHTIDQYMAGKPIIRQEW